MKQLFFIKNQTKILQNWKNVKKDKEVLRLNELFVFGITFF